MNTVFPGEGQRGGVASSHPEGVNAAAGAAAVVAGAAAAAGGGGSGAEASGSKPPGERKPRPERRRYATEPESIHSW